MQPTPHVHYTIHTHTPQHTPHSLHHYTIRTGFALHDVRGEVWSEVTAASLLLGYEKEDDGVCPVVVHPHFGMYMCVCVGECVC